MIRENVGKRKKEEGVIKEEVKRKKKEAVIKEEVGKRKKEERIEVKNEGGM